MKKAIHTFMILLIVSFCFNVSGADLDLTYHNLKGFTYWKNILEFKDVKLPKPQLPKEGGISTGAVFILGRYLPPPYEVTVEGNQVLINGVPCTRLKELCLTEEDKTENKRRRIISPIETHAMDIYQRTKWYEGRETAERKLREYLAGLDDAKLIDIEKSDAEKSIVAIEIQIKTPSGEIKKMKHALQGNEEVEKRVEHIKKQMNTYEFLGYEPIYDQYQANGKMIIAKLNHPAIGVFNIEVESPRTERNWIDRESLSIISDKQCELKEEYRGTSVNYSVELIEFASNLPWVKTFEIKKGEWFINGDSLENIGYHHNCLKEEQTATPEEIYEAERKEAQEFKAPQIRKSLKDNAAFFFMGREFAFRNEPDVVPLIREIIISAVSLIEKRERLINLFLTYKKGEHECKKAAEFISVFGEDWGK